MSHPEIDLAVKNARSAMLKGNDKLLQLVSEYIQDYEYRHSDGGGYVPNEIERTLIEDAIHGLIAEGEFCSLIAENEQRRTLIESFKL